MLTQLNGTMLQEIASINNGRYFISDDEEAPQETHHDLDLQLTNRGEAMEVTSIFAGGISQAPLIGGGLSFWWHRSP